MRLLDLVEQHDGVRPAAHRFGELPALFVADVSGRCADQPRDRVLLHVLRHVDADHRLGVVEHELGERRATSVLPTPVGPRKMNEPIGRFGFLRPARERRIARVTRRDRLVLADRRACAAGPPSRAAWPSRPARASRPGSSSTSATMWAMSSSVTLIVLSCVARFFSAHSASRRCFSSRSFSSRSRIAAAFSNSCDLTTASFSCLTWRISVLDFADRRAAAASPAGARATRPRRSGRRLCRARSGRRCSGRRASPRRRAPRR